MLDTYTCMYICSSISTYICRYRATYMHIYDVCIYVHKTQLLHSIATDQSQATNESIDTRVIAIHHVDWSLTYNKYNNLFLVLPYISHRVQ